MNAITGQTVLLVVLAVVLVLAAYLLPTRADR